MNIVGADIQTKIDWSGPRLLCIAENFTKYDEHAVQQINRNIELFRYRHYGGELLVLELVNATTSSPDAGGLLSASSKGTRPVGKTVSEYYEQAPADVRALFEALEAFLMALGDDVTKKALKLYFAFRSIKNFVCVEIHPQTKNLLAYVKVDPSRVHLEAGFTRDVTAIGHFGTGELEIRMGVHGRSGEGKTPSIGKL